jgi:hypothetical protein
VVGRDRLTALGVTDMAAADIFTAMVVGLPVTYDGPWVCPWVSLDAASDEEPESDSEVRPSSELRACAPPGIRTQNLRIKRALTTVAQTALRASEHPPSGSSSAPLRPTRPAASKSLDEISEAAAVSDGQMRL